VKIALIGTHGVGKTTLCYGLAARLKARDLSLDVVREVARRCPLPINEATGLSAQSWILHTQIAEETAAAALYDMVICDRSVLDNYAYLLLATGPQAPLEPLVEAWMATYDLHVHVPIVDGPASDGVRSADPAFQLAIDRRLDNELERRRLDCVRLDRDDRSRWLDTVEDLVLARLALPQLELL
jgi:nicotinamide riboside kinase